MASLGPKSILFLRSGAMGDCVVTVPLIKLVRETFPEARITLLGDPYSGPILEGCPHIDEIILMDHCPGHKRAYYTMLVRLRSRKFDLILDSQASGRTRIQTALVGAPRRVSFDKQHWAANVFYTDVVHLDRGIHSVIRESKLLAPFGVTVEPDKLKMELWPDESHAKNASDLLAQHGVMGPYAMLQVTTAQRPEFRVWPPEYFAAVADHLAGKGFEVVVTSLAPGHPTIQALAEAATCPIHDLSGETHPLVLAALLKQAGLYVGYNTGPMHVASAVGTPIVGLIDVPGDMLEWYPWTDAPFRTVQAKPVPEEPGWRLDTVTAAEVISAIEEVLEERHEALAARPLTHARAI